jgi:drug/metabolite transporter (DMT)-like permease
VRIEVGRQEVLPLAAALVTVLFWASAFVAIRHVRGEFSAGPLALGRLLIGSAILGAAARLQPRRWPSGRQWALLAVCGLLWFGLYNVALNAAERRLDAGTAAMLVNIGPILIAVLAGLLLGEGFPRRLVAGSAVGFAGVAVIGLATSSRSSADSWGVLLCLLAAASYAVAVVAQKRLVTNLPGLQVTWLACTIGLVGCLPYGPQLVRETAAAGGSTIGWVVYLGVFPTAVGFSTWAYALSRTSAGRLGATTYLVPPLAVLLGWLLLGETPAPLAFVGGAVCLAGVVLARQVRRAPAPASVPAPAAADPAGEPAAPTAAGLGLTAEAEGAA